MTGTVNDVISRCLKCGQCLQSCPVLTAFIHGADTALLMDDITDLVLGGPCTGQVKELLWTCMGCGQCRLWCPEKIAPDVFAAGRRELLRRGLAPVDKLQQWLPDSPYHFGRLISTMFLDEKQPWTGSPAPPGTTVDIVVYLGCYVLAIPEIALTMIALAKKTGMSVAALGGNGLCCGAAYLLNGKNELAQKARQYSAGLIKSYRPRQAVFECASCHAFISPLLAGIESVHHVDFLCRNISKLNLHEEGKKAITYHDSCDPRRGITGDYETPRRLLSSLPGVSLVEMKHNRQDSICCGGLANTTNPGATERLRIERLKEAAATGAEMMVTTCRSCYGAMVGFDREVPAVTHDVLLVGQYAGITVPGYFRNLVSASDPAGILAGARELFTARGLDANKATSTVMAFLERHRPRKIK